MYKVVSKLIKSIAAPCVLCKTRLTGLRSHLPLPPLFSVQRKVRTTRIVGRLIHSTFTSINPPVKASSRYCHELKRTNLSAGLVYSEKQSEVRKPPVRVCVCSSSEGHVVWFIISIRVERERLAEGLNQ